MSEATITFVTILWTISFFLTPAVARKFNLCFEILYRRRKMMQEKKINKVDANHQPIKLAGFNRYTFLRFHAATYAFIDKGSIQIQISVSWSKTNLQLTTFK